MQELKELVGQKPEDADTVFDLIENVYEQSVLAMNYDAETNTVTYYTGDGKEHSFVVQDKDTTYTLATDEKTGLTKLYAVTGSAEDGTMTQKAITEELNKKVGVSLSGETLIFTI